MHWGSKTIFSQKRKWLKMKIFNNLRAFTLDSGFSKLAGTPGTNCNNMLGWSLWCLFSVMNSPCDENLRTVLVGYQKRNQKIHQDKQVKINLFCNTKTSTTSFFNNFLRTIYNNALLFFMSDCRGIMRELHKSRFLCR